MNQINRHPASFRDPNATVFLTQGKIMRGLSELGSNRYQFARDSGLLDELEGTGSIVKSRDVEWQGDNGFTNRFLRVLEHEVVPFVSYPYEWPFSLLKRAALLHLEIHLAALKKGVTLIDASAYNIQFQGIEPIFIDIASFRPYIEGELWAAHRQFCEQFLNPLLLNSIRGIPHNAWYRGSLEGLTTESIAALMPLRYWFSPRMLVNVLLPAKGQKLYAKQEKYAVGHIRKASMPISAHVFMLEQLYKWIAQLSPLRQVASTWQDYSETRTYEAPEMMAKRAFVAEFSRQVRPRQLWDIGCNDGEFSEVALQNGTDAVIGFDADQGALEKAYLRAKQRNLNLLPLYQDAANPSPCQGWLGRERDSIHGRGLPDALLSLAFEHHLAIGRNIPLQEVVKSLTALAPKGVIEFVQKSDQTVQRMISLKGDFFPYYSEETFTRELKSVARIVKFKTISASGRKLFWYER